MSLTRFRGPTGTYTSPDPRIEQLATARLGLIPTPVATQVVARDCLAEWMFALSMLASVAESVAIELRHCQRFEPRADSNTRMGMWSIRIWYGLLSLWARSMSHGVVLLALGEAGPGERFGQGAVTAWKLLAVGGVLGICWTAGRSVVAFHALVVGWVAWMLSERLYAVPPPDDSPVVSPSLRVIQWLLPLVLLRPHRRGQHSITLRSS
jgi:hypothetical protein